MAARAALFASSMLKEAEPATAAVGRTSKPVLGRLDGGGYVVVVAAAALVVAAVAALVVVVAGLQIKIDGASDAKIISHHRRRRRASTSAPELRRCYPTPVIEASF